MSTETRTLPEFPQYTFRADGAVLSSSRPRGIRSHLVHGRPVVYLVGGTKRSRALARLIYTAFYGPPPPAHRVFFRDGNPLNCAADNLYCSPYTIPSRWPAGHIRQSTAVYALRSDTCRECGGLFDSRDLQFVVGRTDRRCRFCRDGLLADVPEHERHEAAEGAFGVPTYSTEELLDIRHLCIELWDLIKALPDPQPHVLYYRFWEDRSQDETGGIIGRSKARVWQLESRAIRQLRKVMHAHPDVKAAAAEAEDRAVQRIAANPALWARKWLAVFPRLSRYWLDRLAVDPNADVRWLVATRKDLPDEVEERLAKDPVWQVRQAVEPEVSRRKSRAAVEQTNHEDRLRRAHDADPRVRKEAATDPSMPASVVAELAADVDSDVRYMIAVRPKLPRELLDRLAQDPVWQVREAAERAIRRLQSTSKGTSP